MVDAISLKNQAYGCLQTSAKNAHQAIDCLRTTIKNNADEIKVFGAVLGAGLAVIPVISFLSCLDKTSYYSDTWPPMRGKPISVCMMNADSNPFNEGQPNVLYGMGLYTKVITAFFAIKWTATAAYNRFWQKDSQTTVHNANLANPTSISGDNLEIAVRESQPIASSEKV